jgi:hypothetical protein
LQIIDATDDIRWTIDAIAKALDKPVLQIVGDTVRREDWHLRPRFAHSFREVGPGAAGLDGDRVRTDAATISRPLAASKDRWRRQTNSGRGE